MKSPIVDRREQRVRVATTEFRFTDGAADQNPRVSGYAAVFDSEMQVRFSDDYTFVEVIKPGAFTNALKNSTDVLLNCEHDDARVLADLVTRTLTLTQDETGLHFDAELDPTDPDVQRVIPKLKRGTLRGCSFAFTVARDGDTWEMTDSETRRTITDIEQLYDVTVTARPAYPDTSVALRSLEHWKSTKVAPPASTHNKTDQLRRRIALAACE